MPWYQILGGTQPGSVTHPPDRCDLCNRQLHPHNAKTATCYDAKTVDGPWAWVCEECFKGNCISLGPGLGQKYEWRSK